MSGDWLETGCFSHPIAKPSRVLKQTTQIILTQTEIFSPDSDVDEFIFLSQQKERESFSSNEN